MLIVTLTADIMQALRGILVVMVLVVWGGGSASIQFSNEVIVKREVLSGSEKTPDIQTSLLVQLQDKISSLQTQVQDDVSNLQQEISSQVKESNKLQNQIDDLRDTISEGLSAVDNELDRFNKTTALCCPKSSVDTDAQKSSLKFKALVNITIYNGVIGHTSVKTLQRDSDSAEACLDTCWSEFKEECNVYSYSIHDRSCMISTLDFYDSWTDTVFQEGVTSYYRYNPESWKMVYRRPKLVKTPRWTNQVTGPWMDPSFATDTISSEDETTRDGTAAKVLKSNIVPFWQQMGISKIRLGIYVGRKEVKYVIFSGQGATSDSWFSVGNLMSNSWSGLSSEKLPLALDWWWRVDPLKIIPCRGLYIVQSHAGCPNDFVYMTAIQNQNNAGCDWEKFPEAELPKILYSPSSTTANNAADLLEADSIRFSIQI